MTSEQAERAVKALESIATMQKVNITIVLGSALLAAASAWFGWWMAKRAARRDQNVAIRYVDKP